MTCGSSQWRRWVLNESDSRPFITRAVDLGPRDRFVVATRACAPIVGVSKLPYFEDAVASLSLRSTREDEAHPEAPDEPHPVPGFGPSPTR